MKPLRTCLTCLTVFFLFALAAATSALAQTAYVANLISGNVSVINTADNKVSPTPIKVGTSPGAIAITPDGKTAYVANLISGNVSVINTADNTVSSTITVGEEPAAIAITPDGKTAYVANEISGTVSVINTADNKVSPTTITVGTRPLAIAITADGKTAYVANFGPNLGSGNVSVINTADNTVSSTITVGNHPAAIAITPDGKTAYVANFGSKNVSVINTADNTVSSTPITVGTEPAAIAITPDGKTAYVANEISENVSVINTADNTVSSTITVGIHTAGIAITADGKTAYVANFDPNLSSENVSVINTADNTVSPTPITVGTGPFAIAISPNQSPRAAFTAPPGRPGVPVTLDALASKDLDSQIKSFAWSFGDGQSQTSSIPTATHAFAKPGTYSVSLNETDAEGCSTARQLVFTGQTAMGCAGDAAAQVTKTITVAYPGVRVTCPKSAKPRGCVFKLQAIATKPKRGKTPKAESAIAKAKAKAGRSAIVSLRPKPTFTAKLASSQRILVKETVLAKGESTTRYLRLQVVQ